MTQHHYSLIRQFDYLMPQNLRDEAMRHHIAGLGG